MGSCQLIGDKASPLSYSIKEGHVDIAVPVIKCDQKLRNLRHIEGSKKQRNAIAFAQNNPEYEWKSTDLSLEHVLQTENNDNLLLEMAKNYSNENGNKRKRKRLQKLIAEELIYCSKIPHFKCEYSVGKLVNGLYNTHSSAHVHTCWNKKTCECRYKFPKKSSDTTRIEVSREEYDWFDYNGRTRKRRAISIIPLRGKYDVCMNTYCPVISESKIACNSNISLVTNGKFAFYITKYISKDTQKEDNGDYEAVMRYVVKRLTQEKFDSPVSESMSRLIGTCLSYNSTNVISATMAKFLIDRNSRFGMSHTIFYIPIYELKRILDREELILRLETDNMPNNPHEVKNYFISSGSFHYLFRPSRFEMDSPLEFFSKYKFCMATKKITDNKNEEFWNFQDHHPAYEYQIIQKRTNPVVPGINNWEFIDTSNLNGDILDKETKIGQQEEDYARTVLTLCYAYRTKDDQMKNGSFVEKYREVYNTHIKIHQNVLQNIQNIRNATRQPIIHDDLENCTEQYIPDESNENVSANEDEEDMVEADPVEQNFIDSLCKIISDEFNIENESANMNAAFSSRNSITSNSPIENTNPSSLDFIDLRNRGSYKCGYVSLSPSLETMNQSNDIIQSQDSFVEIEHQDDRSTTNCNTQSEGNITNGATLNLNRMISVIISNTTRVIEDNQEF